jgi:hypothetical protein
MRLCLFFANFVPEDDDDDCDNAVHDNDIDDGMIMMIMRVME